ncbi:XRE family transcriptional regulator [Enterococcus phage vB_EfaS_785CC]|nr:XRE family transcriptional regulator [Enterococcus phage vB_EfaS_785CC]
MNNMHMFRKLFPNGWVVDVKHNPDGFGEMYTTNYPYSVITYKRDTGFTKFVNIEKPSEVFQYIAEVQNGKQKKSQLIRVDLR